MTKTNERRKEISEFALKLRELIAEVPDGYAKADLNRTLHNLHQRYKVSPENKKREILNRIGYGANRFAELLEETGFSRGQLSRGLLELQSDKKIEQRRVRIHDAGRPVVCYFPV